MYLFCQVYDDTKQYSLPMSYITFVIFIYFCQQVILINPRHLLLYNVSLLNVVIADLT